MRESVILEAPCAANRSLRACFDWRDDRFGHNIELSDQAGSCLLLCSHEGLHADNWPLSPPLQQLHREDRGGGHQVVLLVGMSGREHWSSSVEIDPDGRAITFDVACRVGTPAAALRSTYRIVSNEWNHDRQQDWELTALETDQRLAQIMSDGEYVSIVPATSAAPTVRWKYRIVLTK